MGKATALLNDRANAAWDAIRRSPVAGVYLTELHRLATDIVVSLEAALAAVPVPQPGSGLITVNHEVHRHILNALGAGARLKGLCFDRSKGYKQTDLEHKILLRRAAWVRELLVGIDLAPLKEAQVRNTLEHFDEYVDRLALEAYEGDISMPALVPVDMALSSRNLLSQFAIGNEEPTMYWVRIYISDEKCFINCGHEVRVEPLRLTAGSIRDRLGPLLGNAAEHDGSSMLVLTERSFKMPKCER